MKLAIGILIFAVPMVVFLALLWWSTRKLDQADFEEWRQRVKDYEERDE